MEQAAWEKRLKSGRANVEDKPEKPVEPVVKQICTTDSTIEAMSVMLANNPAGILFEQDELAAWVQSMNMYRGGLGADRQKWLSFWSGKDEIINRKGSLKPLILQNPYICMTGGIQPGILPKLLSIESGKDDGFVDRILFCFPNPTRRQWTDKNIVDERLNLYAKLVDRVFDRPTQTLVFLPEGKELLIS